VELKLVESTKFEQESAIASGTMDFGFCHETGNEDEAIEICEDKVYAAFPAHDIDLCGMKMQIYRPAGPPPPREVP
ncbi:hypothetical protein, partial [Phenylobacterium sp.]|uniref:hypothetical protein n=1 Tax=Phenylobacterium sp. TaxID=1871053 RepID=UPI0027343E04